MPIWNIITDLGVILFIFNCWTSWWMGMIENGTIRFQEQTWKRCELPYKSHPYRFMYRHLKTQLMVTKILSRYDDKFAATFFTRTGFFFLLNWCLPTQFFRMKNILFWRLHDLILWFIFDLIRSEIMPQQRPFTLMEEEEKKISQISIHKYG